ncbi:hypothetical protein P343_11610 [Sporolactobacillus laevolacticus DSM 442]|uniref:Calcineurin-like phosphoesterase domain-containing protein n=1 Tax=Sporolactobacillus laevolacticus DSM 442 TaxID=1395513 RepID=V6IXS0_9BACL|nr:hypothetical protein P343_11610 [Sporolactobacillus laevolacticus DSM 442]
MKIAIITDIHGNYPALKAALASAIVTLTPNKIEISFNHF